MRFRISGLTPILRRVPDEPPPAQPAGGGGSPPAPPAAPSPPAPDQEPGWLKGRLEREQETTRKAILTELGVPDVKDGKAAIAELKKRQDAEKTDLEKKDGRIKELEPQAARAVELEKTVKARADVEFAALTDEQKAAVKSLAGDDPAKVLTAIDTLKPTWKAPAAPPTPGAPPPKPAPATTSGANPPPAPANPPPAIDHLAVFEDLQKKNPMQAAHYAEHYGAQISAAREAKRKTSA